MDAKTTREELREAQRAARQALIDYVHRIEARQDKCEEKFEEKITQILVDLAVIKSKAAMGSAFVGFVVSGLVSLAFRYLG